MDRKALEVVGTIGDVNPLDYGGGFVYQDKVGALSVEWYEPADEDAEEDSAILCWRVDLDHGAESWMDLASVAKSAGVDEVALRAMFDSDNPMERASAFECVAGYHGWNNLDGYPLRLTRAEAEARIGGQ